MAVLETLEQRASDYLEETRQLIWKHVRYVTIVGCTLISVIIFYSGNLNSGLDAGDVTEDEDESGGFIPLLELRPTHATSLQAANDADTSASAPGAPPVLPTPSASSIRFETSSSSRRGKKLPTASTMLPLPRTASSSKAPTKLQRSSSRQMLALTDGTVDADQVDQVDIEGHAEGSAGDDDGESCALCDVVNGL